ncbi:MAG: hypothetical protein WAR24_19565, partial [Candidatus Acidiferrales bacterium]
MKPQLSRALHVVLISLFPTYLSLVLAIAGSAVLDDFRTGPGIDRKSQAATMAPSKPHIPGPEAQQLYLNGQESLAKVAKLQDYGKTRKEVLEKAIEYFEQAVTKDPNYAAAYLALAQSYASLQVFGGARAKDTCPKVKAAAAKAIEIDEQLAEAHDVLAQAKFGFDWDWSGAEAEFRRARELNPKIGGFPFSSYAGLLAAVGRFDESLDETKRVSELNPNAGRSHFDLG